MIAAGCRRPYSCDITNSKKGFSLNGQPFDADAYVSPAAKA